MENPIEEIISIFEGAVGKDFKSDPGNYTIRDIVEALYSPESEAWKWIRRDKVSESFYDGCLQKSIAQYEVFCEMLKKETSDVRMNIRWCLMRIISINLILDRNVSSGMYLKDQVFYLEKNLLVDFSRVVYADEYMRKIFYDDNQLYSIYRDLWNEYDRAPRPNACIKKRDNTNWEKISKENARWDKIGCLIWIGIVIGGMILGYVLNR